MPVEEEILGEEGGSDHAAPVVHESSCVQFSHRCIHNWKTSFTCLPCLKVLAIVLPFHFVEFGLEGVVLPIENSRKVMADINVKISPV